MRVEVTLLLESLTGVMLVPYKPMCVEEADQHLCVREDGFPAVRGKNRNGRPFNDCLKYLTASCVAVLQAHRGDGAAGLE